MIKDENMKEIVKKVIRSSKNLNTSWSQLNINKLSIRYHTRLLHRNNLINQILYKIDYVNPNFIKNQLYIYNKNNLLYDDLL